MVTKLVLTRSGWVKNLSYFGFPAGGRFGDGPGDMSCGTFFVLWGKNAILEANGLYIIMLIWPPDLFGLWTGGWI